MLVVDPGVHTLLDFHFRPHVKAENGKGGAGSNRDGANGDGPRSLRVPDGTVVQTVDGEVLADLVGVGTTFEVARGGRGGRGNAALANTRRKAPGFAELGEPGRAARRRARAQERGRRRPGRLPERRQVLADRGASPRPGRRSPTTRSPRWCPTWAWSRPATTRSRSPTCRADPRRGHRQGSGPGVPAPHRALRRAGARRRLRRPWSPAATRWPTSTRSRRSCRVRRAGGPAPAGRAEQGRRTRRPGPGRHRAARPRGPRLPVFEVSAATREGLRSSMYAMAETGRAPGRSAADRSRPGS